MNSIVIGSGFGGIAAALRLKAKGHKVTLIEKHPDLGGRARVFKRNGFTFDGGPTVITAPYLINELFELFQKDPKDYIKLSPLKVWYQFIFEDKSKFNYSGNENEMKTQIQELNKEDVKGYKKLVKELSFGIKMGGGQSMQAMMALVDKDLGNIKLEQDVTQLQSVTVTSSAKPQFEMGIDRKIFNVDKNLASTGQTAVEVMKNIPNLNVDIDGNVTLRNATPTLLIDNRPTTLTLDQIPADIIDKVEIITNPSAKYDASGGNAGILNIVLKKNKKNGYNGGLRTGIDMRGRTNNRIWMFTPTPISLVVKRHVGLHLGE